MVRTDRLCRGSMLWSKAALTLSQGWTEQQLTANFTDCADYLSHTRRSGANGTTGKGWFCCGLVLKYAFSPAS